MAYLDPAENPPLDGEAFDQYGARLDAGISTQDAQTALAKQQAQQQADAQSQFKQDQAATAAAYKSQGVASYTTSNGALQPLIDPQSQQPMTGDGNAGGIVYGQDGSPQRVTFPTLDTPRLVDAYSPEGGGKTQTDEAGNTYATSPGVAWKWTGTDPSAQAQKAADDADAQFREQHAALTDAATVYGSQVSQAKKIMAGHQKALDDNTAAIQGIPELATDFDPDDEDAARKLPQAFAPTDPVYNEHSGFWGGGGLTPAAVAARNDLATRQKQAQSLLQQRALTQQNLAGIQRLHDTAQQRLDSANAQRVALIESRLKGDGIDLSGGVEDEGDDPEFDAAQAATNAAPAPGQTTQAYSPAAATGNAPAPAAATPAPTTGAPQARTAQPSQAAAAPIDGRQVLAMAGPALAANRDALKAAGVQAVKIAPTQSDSGVDVGQDGTVTISPARLATSMNKASDALAQQGIQGEPADLFNHVLAQNNVPGAVSPFAAQTSPVPPARVAQVRQSWQNTQQTLLSQYPQIGVAGSPANVAFVKAFRANGGNVRAALAALGQR